MTRDDYTFLGKIRKTRGLAGLLVVRSERKISRIRGKWESVMVEMDGLLVPFFIAEWDITGDYELTIAVEDVNTPEKAERLTGKSVYIKKSLIVFTSGDYLPGQIYGFLVIDNHSGTLGRITGIDDIPGNPLLRLEHQGREILIPLHEDLIAEINTAEKIVRVNLPEGFLKL